MGVAFVPVYIEYLGVEAFGLIGLYLAFQALMVIVDMGFTPAINREMARFKSGVLDGIHAKQLLLSLERVFFSVSILIVLVFWLCAPWISNKLLNIDASKVAAMTEAISIMGFAIVFRWLSLFYRSVILGLQYQVWLSGINIVFSTIRAVGVIGALEYYSPTIKVFFIFQASIFAIECVLLKWQANRFFPSGEKVIASFAKLYDLLPFVSGLAGINILAVILTQSDKIIISLTQDLTVLGYYTLAASVSGSIYLLISPISNAVFPRFTEYVSLNDTASLLRAYKSSSQLLAVLLVPVCVLISLFAERILYLWSGSTDLSTNTGGILSILILGSMFNGLSTIPYILQLAYGWTKLAFLMNFVAVIVFLPACYFGVNHFGIKFVAWAWLLLNVCYLMASISIMHSRLLQRAKFYWLWNAVVAPLLVCSLVYALFHQFGFNTIDVWILELLYFCFILLTAMVVLFICLPFGRDLIQRINHERKSSKIESEK